MVCMLCRRCLVLLSLSLVVSTLLTIAVTGLAMSALVRVRAPDRREGGSE